MKSDRTTKSESLKRFACRQKPKAARQGPFRTLKARREIKPPPGLGAPARALGKMVRGQALPGCRSKDPRRIKRRNRVPARRFCGQCRMNCMQHRRPAISPAGARATSRHRRKTAPGSAPLEPAARSSLSPCCGCEHFERSNCSS